MRPGVVAVRGCSRSREAGLAVTGKLGLTVAAALIAATACSSGNGTAEPTTPADRETTTPPAASPTPTPTETSTPTPSPAPVVFDPAAAFSTVERLAGEIGPREATSDAFREAAEVVDSRFRMLGYEVDTVPVPVPAGVSWGVPVPEGESANLVATPPGFDPAAPHLLVGAHLDTVPQAPGAEDNASGIGVMLELARMAEVEPPPLPVVFVAFGAEEPRGEGDALHHFGSQQMVREMDDAQRAALAGMLALDRVGVSAERLPVCHGGRSPDDVRDALLAAADRLGIPAEACENRASDHWSFEKGGFSVARLGSVPYDGYHSPGDVPSVVDPDQLDRAGRTAWEWLRSQS